MDDLERVALLTDHQRECLELYWQQYGIGEIADRIGISVSAVNQRLSGARKLLGVSSSQAAARMMAEFDRRRGIWIPPTGSENTVSEAEAIEPDDPAIDAGRTAEDHLADFGNGPDMAATPPMSGASLQWPFPTAGRPDNDLTATSRMGWVLPIAILSMVLLMIAGLLVIGAQDVVVRLQHSIARLH